MSPQQVFDILTQGLSGTPRLEISSDHDGLFTMKITEENGKYSDFRAIDLDEKEIEIGQMKVDLKGQGIGKTILRNYIELGVHLKLNRFMVNASSDNGAYAWARAGVPLDDGSDYGEIKKTLEKRLKAIKKHLPTDVYLKAFNLIQLKDIYAVANLDFVLPKELSIDFEGSFSQKSDEEERILKIEEFCDPRDLGFTLGRYLLNGATYDGCIDFFDPKTMCSLEKSFGGFETIALTDVDAEFEALRAGIPTIPQVQQPAGLQHFGV